MEAHITSQKMFFLKNIGPNDFHIVLYLKKILIGYVCLRKQKLYIKNKDETKNYLHFDTCIVKKQFRGKNYTKLLMNFTNKVIENSKCISILYCEKNLVTFYKKYGWKISNKKLNNFIQPTKNKITMQYNLK